ncbi:hypothetical protein [Pseudomonas abietaniphila]|uniref:hypothetical protein n=1 Tax=Pseudomonas abietaniphila TaxID=89065 RepID=UPI000AB139C7|nr:hypothetical protein [Pseudomonas abietaniphila]
MQAVTNWRNGTFPKGDPKNEIIILDFHQFKNFTDEAHYELMKLIKDYFGDLIIRPEQRNLYVRELWGGTGRVVVAYHDVIRDDEFFWDLEQKYEGSGYISTERLKGFMDEVARTSKPDSELQSIQCHKITKVGQPDDFQDQIGRWFYSNDEVGFNAYIQKFHIINTDWSTRGAYIDYCIHATWIRAKSYAAGQNVFVDNPGSFKIPPLQTPLIYVIIRAEVPNVYLPVYEWFTLLKGQLLRIYNMSGISSILHMAGSDHYADSIEIKANVEISLTYDKSVGLWRLDHSPTMPTEISNFRVTSPYPAFPVEFVWDPLPLVSEYTVFEINGERVEKYVVHEPRLVVDSIAGGVWHVEADFQGTPLISAEIVARITNLKINSSNGRYPITLSWDDVPYRITDYKVIGRGYNEHYEAFVSEPSLVISSGQSAVFSVSTQVDSEGTTLKSADVAFSLEDITQVNNFRITSPGTSSPLIFEWDPVPDASSYRFIALADGQPSSQQVVESRLVVDNFTSGLWHVETWWGTNLVRSKTLMTYTGSGEPPPVFKNFRVSSPDSYPLIFTWDPIPEASEYTVWVRRLAGNKMYHVNEPTLSVESDGDGIWHVETDVKWLRIVSEDLTVEIPPKAAQ